MDDGDHRKWPGLVDPWGNRVTALADWDDVPDATLATAAAAGDRAAFGAIYDRYADRLHDFCIGMLRDREAAADCVQETFCTAATGLSRLREPEKLRPWLYAVSRSQALRYLNRRRREQPAEDVPDTASGDAGPDTLAGHGELAQLIADACGGLSDRDREVLDLTYRHGLDGPELGEALGVTPAHANTLAHRVREMVGRALGALLVARAVQADPQRCPELATVLSSWDGTMTVLMRKRVARHIESCETCEEEQRRRVSPAALLSAPFFIPAPALLRDRALQDFQLTCAAKPLDGSPPAAAGDNLLTAPHGLDLGALTVMAAAVSEPATPEPPAANPIPEPARKPRGPLLPIGVFIVAALLFAGLATVGLYRADTSVTQTVNDVPAAPAPGAAPLPAGTQAPARPIPAAPPSAPASVLPKGDPAPAAPPGAPDRAPAPRQNPVPQREPEPGYQPPVSAPEAPQVPVYPPPVEVLPQLPVAPASPEPLPKFPAPKAPTFELPQKPDLKLPEFTLPEPAPAPGVRGPTIPQAPIGGPVWPQWPIN